MENTLFWGMYASTTDSVCLSTYMIITFKIIKITVDMWNYPGVDIEEEVIFL